MYITGGIVYMPNSLASIIEKNEERMVDKAATSLKVMFGVGYADVAQEDLEERLYKFFDAFAEIAKQSESDPSLLQEAVDTVMITPVYAGWSNRAITEEVLQVIDMVINQQLESQLGKPEQADEKKNAQDFLAQIIREAKDFVNGTERQRLAERKARAAKRGGSVDSNESEGVPVS